MERFFSEAAITPGTRLAYRGSHKAFHPLVQNRYLDEIDRRMLGEFISRRKQAGITDTTIRRDLAFLSSLCAMAVRWGWLGTNPVTALNKRALKASRPRTRFLTPAELDQLLAATADHIRPAIIIAAETGLRKEELFSLTLSGIDLTRREIRLDHTKSGIPRRVPLSDKAVTTIKAILQSAAKAEQPLSVRKG